MSYQLELNCQFANFYSAMTYPGPPLYRTAIENGWQLQAGCSGYDCLPLPTEKLSAMQVLDFAMRRSTDIFGGGRYIESITRHKLRRQIIEDMDMSDAQSIA